MSTRTASLVGVFVGDDPLPEGLENGPVKVCDVPIHHVATRKLIRSALQLLDSSLLVSTGPAGPIGLIGLIMTVSGIHWTLLSCARRF